MCKFDGGRWIGRTLLHLVTANGAVCKIKLTVAVENYHA